MLETGIKKYDLSRDAYTKQSMKTLLQNSKMMPPPHAGEHKKENITSPHYACCYSKYMRSDGMANAGILAYASQTLTRNSRIALGGPRPVIFRRCDTTATRAVDKWATNPVVKEQTEESIKQPALQAYRQTGHWLWNQGVALQTERLKTVSVTFVSIFTAAKCRPRTYRPRRHGIVVSKNTEE